jgi:stearoyl-CoA desaturase (delta-9 desaturase)
MLTTTAARPESAGIAWGSVLWLAGLHAGALGALVPGYFSWQALAVCFFLYWLTACIGICLTYHRLLTHRSFAMRPRGLEYLLTALACCASEGGPIGWVADHRKHHAHADDEDDVHSPRRGFHWAHMFWWITPNPADLHTREYLRKWAPDLYRDPVHRFLERIQLVPALLLFAGLYAAGGLPWLVWGGFVRTVAVLHATWLVNSATHLWGYRSYETRDASTNLWWVALLSFGEGWHNNHHAFQTSARHGLRWWELDVTYVAIRVLSAVGLVHSLKLPKVPRRRPSPAEVVPTEGPAGDDRHEGAGEGPIPRNGLTRRDSTGQRHPAGSRGTLQGHM